MAIRTLYRLTGVAPDPDGLFAVLDTERLGERGFDLSFPPELAGRPALLFAGQLDVQRARWAHDATRLTGVELDLRDLRSAAVLLLEVDGEVYAIGFGQGYLLIPDELKDPTFGLRVAVRAIDPDLVHDLVRKSMHGQGRQDSTLAPSGLPIGAIGIRQHMELVRRLGGLLHAGDLGLPGNGAVRIEGSAGLRLPIYPDANVLLNCVRSIAKIIQTDPRPRLAFIETVQPVRDKRRIAELDGLLDDVLRARDVASLSLDVPSDLADDLRATVSYAIRIGAARITGRNDLELADLLARIAVLHRTTPVEALRSGRVELCGDPLGEDVIAGAPALRWLQAVVDRDAHRYQLLEGEWYESGSAHIESLHRQLGELISAQPSVPLLPWRTGEAEHAYNGRLQDTLGMDRFLCLDSKTVRTGFYRGGGLEACDGLGPNGELICIKAASGSPPLSHLVNQALNATEALINQPEVRERFSSLVTDASGGRRTFQAGGRPTKVIFGIHLKDGRPFTPTSLFPLSQVALVNMATTLHSVYGVDVEIIGIPSE